jgi:hypothetical protein
VTDARMLQTTRLWKKPSAKGQHLPSRPPWRCSRPDPQKSRRGRSGRVRLESFLSRRASAHGVARHSRGRQSPFRLSSRRPAARPGDGGPPLTTELTTPLARGGVMTLPAPNALAAPTVSPQNARFTDLAWFEANPRRCYRSREGVPVRRVAGVFLRTYGQAADTERDAETAWWAAPCRR